MSEDTPQNVFEIQRLYVKEISYESPRSPEIFREKWEPEIGLDIQREQKSLAEGIFEVALKTTVTVKQGDNTALLIEVNYAGIFTVLNFPEDEKEGLLNSYCPTIIFPYMRELVSDISTRGGFPPLYLTPINFDRLYAQHLEQKTQDGKAGEAEAKSDDKPKAKKRKKAS